MLRVLFIQTWALLSAAAPSVTRPQISETSDKLQVFVRIFIQKKGELITTCTVSLLLLTGVLVRFLPSMQFVISKKRNTRNYVNVTARQSWHWVGHVTRAHTGSNWKWLSHFNPAQIDVHTQTRISFFFWPCQNRFTAKQYEANKGTIGMTLPLLMKALWKGNLIHQQQLRLRAPCHYQLSTPSLMFFSVDAEPAWRTALSDKSTPSAVQTLRMLIMSVHSHADKNNAPDSVHDELTKLDRNWDVRMSR